jgi:hypothetical protein
MVGSLSGGRYSDYVLAKLKAKNGGASEPEVSSPLLPCLLLPFYYDESHATKHVLLCYVLFS